ncbi:hypothetical protein CDV55_108314 [Aspergillus turcosus]|nr:hypothetical protein CDV55_108314 [Aspergillus turcosus]
MSVTLADPYRDYALDYAQHAKPEGHENTLTYQTQQSHLQRHKEGNPPFPQGSPHSTAYEQHHASTTGLPAANPDISQGVVLTPAHMLHRQLPMQYTPATFEIPPVQRGKKRPHSETEGEGDYGDHGVRPRFHGFGPPESMALPQQHHHHRLPPQALLHPAERHGMNAETSPMPSGPPSVVGQPGMPDPAPRPRGPKLKFTQEEDALLVELKENKNLTWKQIADFFPGRTSGTLQVRYCTKLKAKDVTWTDEMVQRLQRAMQEYENDRWRIIAGKTTGTGRNATLAFVRTTRVWAVLSQVLQSTAGRNGFKLTSNLQTPSPPTLLPPLVQPRYHQLPRTMFLQRTAFALARRTPVRAIAARPFSSSVVRCQKKYEVKKEGKIIPFEDIKDEEDLIPPGAKPGTVPTDVEQATGLERLELIGKMQGIDVFDMRPLDASRKGTLDNPIIVKSAGDEQYAGCTGFPASSHQTIWLTVSRDRPIERCGECGNVVKLEYVGPEEDPHAHEHHSHHPPHEEVKTFADYVKPEYWYR